MKAKLKQNMQITEELNKRPERKSPPKLKVN